MVSKPPITNGDDWGEVRMALFYPRCFSKVLVLLRLADAQECGEMEYMGKVVN